MEQDRGGLESCQVNIERRTAAGKVNSRWKDALRTTRIRPIPDKTQIGPILHFPEASKGTRGSYRGVNEHWVTWYLVAPRIHRRSFRRKRGLILPGFSRSRRLGMRGGAGAHFTMCPLSPRPRTSQRAPELKEL